MSKVKDLTSEGYDNFAPVFYGVYGDDESMIERARRVNIFIETYLSVFGVSEIWELPPEVQTYVNQNAVIRWKLGEAND